MYVKGNQTMYVGCTILLSGQDADRKILNVRFEKEGSEAHWKMGPQHPGIKKIIRKVQS
jgi:hypothetical protein